MRICIVTTEYLGCGPTGGIGVGARALARQLVRRGLDVSAIVPGPRGGAAVPPSIDGVSIRSYSRYDLKALVGHIRACDAEIYHCVQASLAAYLTQQSMPDRAHLVECVDPRDWRDWLIDFRFPTDGTLRLVPSFVYFGTRPASIAARRADAVQVPARFLQAKARRIYRLAVDPHHVPMPYIATGQVEKSASPLVVFLGRLVRRKRPEIVVELARRFPAVRFVFIGAVGDQDYAGEICRRAAAFPNVEFTDFIDQAANDALSGYLSQAWVLINTATREGLPLSFIEAAGHRCAILSACDPDQYASRFGAHVTDGDFARGLEFLLADDRWKVAGEHAHAHVAGTHSADHALDRQLAVYEAALGSCDRIDPSRRLDRTPVKQQ